MDNFLKYHILWNWTIKRELFWSYCDQANFLPTTESVKEVCMHVPVCTDMHAHTCACMCTCTHTHIHTLRIVKILVRYCAGAFFFPFVPPLVGQAFGFPLSFCLYPHFPVLGAEAGWLAVTCTGTQFLPLWQSIIYMKISVRPLSAISHVKTGSSRKVPVLLHTGRGSCEDEVWVIPPQIEVLDPCHEICHFPCPSP